MVIVKLILEHVGCTNYSSSPLYTLTKLPTLGRTPAQNLIN
jgi:hypothetical protein